MHIKTASVQASDEPAIELSEDDKQWLMERGFEPVEPKLKQQQPLLGQCAATIERTTMRQGRRGTRSRSRKVA